MKNNKFLTAVLVGALSLTTASCSNDYLDVNENPNSVQAEKITPDLIIPGAISQAYRTQAGTMMQFGNLMMNSWAGNSYSFGGPFAREFNLATVDNTFYTGIWGLYPRIANFAQVEAYPNPGNKYDQYIAIAKIMKAYYMQYIVDLYGDVPYSEAFKGQDNLTPKYDNDSDVYRNLIQSLEDANALIAADKGDVPSTDVVFGGDMDLWRKFSNTIKLRMLLRMSKVTGELATYRNAKLQGLSTADFIDEMDGDVTVNPGYNGNNDDSLNPFLLNYLLNSSEVTVSNYSLVIVSEHFANAMQGNLILNDPNMTKFNNLGDPRRARLFTNVSGGTYYTGAPYTGLKGIRQGAVPGQPGVPANTNTSKMAVGNFVGANVPGSNTDVINFSNARGGVLMSLAESQLLQAEAALRYPTIFTFSPQTKFNTGVIASGVWLGVASGTMSSYAAAIATRPGLGWTGTDAQKIEAIMTQKWIALTNVNPTEMFIEYNRTGLPYTPLALSLIHI